LRIDGYGNTIKGAQYDMAENVWLFLNENFNNKKCRDRCWLNMYDLSKGDEISTVLWDKYHAIQFMLAERGIATDKYAHLQKKIAELKSKVKKLEKKINDNNRMKSISTILRSTPVEYIRVEVA
jgi:hypothetical protein